MNMENRKRIKRIVGFTLVELIMVIIIIGILSVYAVPRFMSLSGESRRSTLTTLRTDLDTYVASVYDEAKGKGLYIRQSTTFNSTVAGQSIEIAYGYPTLTTIGNYITAKQNAGTQLKLIPISATSVGLTFDNSSFSGYDTTQAQCYVLYSMATGKDLVSAAVVRLIDTGCTK